MATAIVGGTVVGPDGSGRADVLVEDGVVTEVGSVDRSSADVIDASGCLVLPGAVDVHTHPFGGVRDDTRSALCGGTTTALAFVDALPGERPAEAARRTLADEMPESHIDLAFHAVIWEPEAYRPGDLADAAALGIGSVKLWLAYVELGIMADDDVALRVMQEAAELGIVALAHCENGRAVDLLTRQCVAEGRLGIESLPASRPIELEAECVHRFLVLAGIAGATPYVVHVTGRAPLEEIRAARRRRQTVHAEVCPHHLLFERSHHEGPDALRYVMTPPLRTAADRAALLDGSPDRRRHDVRLRPLPPAARPRQGAGAGRLHEDPDRASRDRRPAAARLRARRGRRSARRRAAGRRRLHAARQDLRPLSAQGHRRAGKRRRHRRLGSRRRRPGSRSS